MISSLDTESFSHLVLPLLPPPQVQAVFGMRGIKLALYLDPALKQEVKGDAPVSALAGKTVYIVKESSLAAAGADSNIPASVAWPVCHYVNVEDKGRKGTLLLENPRGDGLNLQELVAQVRYDT